MNPRSQSPWSLRAAALIVLLLILTLTTVSQTQPDPQTLVPNQTIEREMTGAETHRYTFDLQAGEFFQVRVEQIDVRVALRLSKTDGNVFVSIDPASGKNDPVSISFVAAEADSFVLDVIAKESKGRYTIHRLPPHQASLSERLSCADLLSENAETLANTAYPIVDRAGKETQLGKAKTALLNVIALYKDAAILTKGTEKDVYSIYYLFLIGHNYRFIRDFQNSIDYLHQAYDLNNSDHFKPIAFQHLILSEIAFAFDDAENEADAIEYYKKAIFDYEENWKVGKDEKTLSSIVARFEFLLVATSDYGTYQEINHIQQQLLKLTRKFALRDLEQLVNVEIGKTYYDMGQYYEAIKKYEEANRLNEKNAYIEERISRAIATIYLRTGRLDEAEKLYEKSRNLAIARKDSESVSIDTLNIGCVYARTNNLSKNRLAIRIFKKHFSEMESWQQSTDNKIQKLQYARYVLETAFYYALAYRKVEDHANAIQVLKKSIDSTKGFDLTKYEARAFVEIGLDYLSLKKLELAGEHFKKAYLLAKQANVRDEEIASLDGLMNYWISSGNALLAIFYGKQAVNLLQQTRSDLKKVEANFGQGFLNDNSGTYRKLSDILISQGRLPEAQAVLDLLKDEEFSGLLQRGGSDREDIPYSKAEDSALKILDKVAALGREKGELAAKNEKDLLTDIERQRFRALQGEIEVAEAAFNKSLAALSAESDKGQNFDVVAEDAQAFMKDLGQLGSGAVALYTVIVNGSKPTDQPGPKTQDQIKTGWIILVTPEFRKAYPIDVKDLEKTVFAFQAALSSPRYDPQPIAQDLYKRLFLQTSEKVKTTLAADLDEYFKGKSEKTLMWSLDGVLRYIPMAALHDGNTYLAEKYRNTVFNAASKARLKDVPKTKWTALGLGVSLGRTESGKTFSPLAGTKRELLTIVRQKNSDGTHGILPGTIKLDDEFTSDAMYDGLLFDKNPVVHIASHFSYQPADFDQSFLLLGKGILTVRDLSAKSTLFSNVDLLTLSACETAVGGANGKDVEGFAYLAQSLGAEAVMASLWQVDDIGTQVLMPEFYRLHETGIGKAEALREAQLALLQGKINDVPSDLKRAEVVGTAENNPYKLVPYKTDGKPPFAHPYYWAPFVLIGNWR